MRKMRIIIIGRMMMCAGRTNDESLVSFFSLRVAFVGVNCFFGWRGKIGCLCLSSSSENGAFLKTQKHKSTNICVELTQICVLS